MDREAIYARIPNDLQDHINDRPTYRNYLEAFLLEILHQLRRGGGEPDAWEAGCLLFAIGLARCGRYSAAFTWADHALTPLSERSKDYPVREVDPPITLRMLERELEAWRLMPISYY